MRANRQLAVALQAQGLNEEAARFAYRAHVLQRKGGMTTIRTNLGHLPRAALASEEQEREER